MVINLAYAQATQAAGGQSFIIQLLPLILIFVVFYFLLIRPQQKRMKQHRTMVSNIQKGDEVLTSGGVIGKVSSVESDKIIIVEISKDVKIKVKSLCAS